MSIVIVCNLGSLILGLVAWGIPLCAIGRKYRWGICCIASLSCCALSLFLQLVEVKHRVGLNDWSALMDTIDAVVLAAAVMIGGMLISNILALWRTQSSN